MRVFLFKVFLAVRLLTYFDRRLWAVWIPYMAGKRRMRMT